MLTRMIKSKFVIFLLILVIFKVSSSNGNSLDGQVDDPNDTDCPSGYCSYLDHPPDSILTMPPPPLPLFMKELLTDTNSSYFFEDGKCNFCEYLTDHSQDSELFQPSIPDKPADSMTSVIVASILGLSFGTFLLLLIWCKKWKIFPAKDSCPIFPESFLSGSGHKSSPPPSPSPCISPVVNEKSPQSTIITDSSRKTSIPSKYWRRAGDFSNHPQNLGVDSVTDHYTEGSCTSSPVYAELDGPVVGTSSSNSTVLVTGQSPYAVGLNTYSEIPETLRIGSSAGLLPDTSYDNATYLPTTNLYQSHSLRRSHAHHQAKPSPVDGSLLHSDQMLMHAFPHVAYVTTRSTKKSRKSSLAHQLARNSIQRMQDDLTLIQQEGLIAAATAGETSSRNYTGTGSRRNQGQVYMDLPAHSPSISTFKSAYGSYNNRDNKRPLPPVPGVRL